MSTLAWTGARLKSKGRRKRSRGPKQRSTRQCRRSSLKKTAWRRVRPSTTTPTFGWLTSASRWQWRGSTGFRGTPSWRRIRRGSRRRSSKLLRKGPSAQMCAVKCSGCGSSSASSSSQSMTLRTTPNYRSLRVTRLTSHFRGGLGGAGVRGGRKSSATGGQTGGSTEARGRSGRPCGTGVGTRGSGECGGQHPVGGGQGHTGEGRGGVVDLAADGGEREQGSPAQL